MWTRALFAKRSAEQELDDEMRFHLEMEAEKHVRAGMAEGEARRRAALAFGGMDRHKETMRDGWGARGLERLATELRLAARQLRNAPAFTLSAVLTLALGIGGNAAVFSVVHGVLLRPLDYPDADRIVSIGHRSRGGDLPERIPHSSAAYVTYEDARGFEAMALYEPWQGSLTDRESSPEWIDVVRATPTLFDVLRVPPAFGRLFSAAEAQVGGPRAALISHALWMRRYGGDRSILGRVVTVEGLERNIVGVMPPGFAFPTAATDVWVPMRLDRTDLSGFNTPGIGRLRPGITPEQATAELTRLLPNITNVVDFIPAAVLRDSGLRPEVRSYRDEIVGGVRAALWALWAMMGLVLLIACVNVTSLLLVRAEARRREAALRLALGAARRHLLTESFAVSAMLLLLGSILGLGLAIATVRVLPRVAPAVLPRLSDIRVDGTVILATAAIALVAAVLFALVPVARRFVGAPGSLTGGNDRSGTPDRRSGRLRQVLVVAQVAMATVLLVASGLVLRSFQKVREIDPGFSADSVVTFRIALPPSRYADAGSVARFHYAMLDRLRALPGVAAAGATGQLPLAGYSSLIDPLRVDGRPYPPGVMPPLVEMRVATPGYFEAMRIPLITGRSLERADTEGRTGAVVVTERVATTVMSSVAPLGARVAHGLGGVSGEREWSNVVGVVGDVRGVALDQEPMGAVYYALVNREGVNMDWIARSMVYAVRAGNPPAAVVAGARTALADLDSELPLAETRTLQSVVDDAEGGMRFAMLGVTAAALIGLAMGAIGLYGVLSYVTAQRTREIGVRIALGASPGSVRAAVLRHGMAVAASGLTIGLVAALALRSVATPMLYGVAPTDPLTLIAASAVLLAAGGLATWLPARRASRLDPVRALRWD
jgi:predicted permease